jgi:uncharacterized protein (TIGR00159 family)
MTELVQAVWATIARIDLRAALDILIVALVIYWVLLLLRGTTAMTVLRGIAILFLGGFLLSSVFQLTVLSWILRNALTALLVAIPILFAPELRRALERIGRTGKGWLAGNHQTDRMIEVVTEAATRMAARRFGCLIVIERDTGLQEYIDSGVEIDAVLSVEILVSIFYTNSPLHDGAVVIRNNRIAAARCVFPLSDNLQIGSHLGTRHRAAMGISERTDAVSVVVSEERGTISVASDGHIAVQADDKRLMRTLAGLFGSSAAPVALLDRFRRAS